MPEQKRVMIAHPDGREYSILPSDFTNPRVSPDRESYADRGFRIVSYADGTPYEGPKTKRELDRAAEERQAAREERAAAKSDAGPQTKPKGD